MNTKDIGTDHDPRHASLGWPLSDHVGEPQLAHLFVVVDELTLTADDPTRTPLLSRVRLAAAAFGCRVTLYAPCADEILAQGYLGTDTAVLERRQALVDLAATRLAEVACWLEGTAGVEVIARAFWEPLDESNLQRRLSESRPDLVMKSSIGSSFVIGLLSNIDWELIRHSPVPVWYVTGDDDRPRIANVLTTLGISHRSDEVITARDYHVCALASLIAAKTGSSHTILHTYQIPQELPPYSAYAPEIAALPPEFRSSDQERLRTVAEKHRDAILSFARFFLIDREHVLLRAGRIDRAAPEVAAQMNADLLIMGARSLTRMQRLLQPVNAETILSRAPCDVLVVTEAHDGQPAAPTEAHLEGRPRFDLEAAVIDPERVFGSPLGLVSQSGLSLNLRRRLLAIWENDVRAEMVEEEEGGVIRSSCADRLQALHQARVLLDSGPAPASMTQPEYS